MEEPLLTCEGLAVGHGGRAVASGIEFALRSGEALGVIGENGAGKSTLLRTLLGLQPALAGVIRFGAALSPGDIGYLPQQNPVQRDFPATALEVALSGCQAMRGARPFFRAPERRLAEEALARVGAADYANRPFRELSGGQRQRVLLARALCAGRRLLILDEPVTGLDPAAAGELYRTLAALRREGRAILAVTHVLPAGLEDATHVLELGPRPFFDAKSDWLARSARPKGDAP